MNLLKSLLLIEKHPKSSYTLVGGTSLSQGFKNCFKNGMLYIQQPLIWNLWPFRICHQPSLKNMWYFPGIWKGSSVICGNYILLASVTLYCFNCPSIPLLCSILSKHIIFPRQPREHTLLQDSSRGKNFHHTNSRDLRQLLLKSKA